GRGAGFGLAGLGLRRAKRLDWHDSANGAAHFVWYSSTGDGKAASCGANGAAAIRCAMGEEAGGCVSLAKLGESSARGGSTRSAAGAGPPWFRGIVVSRGAALPGTARAEIGRAPGHANSVPMRGRNSRGGGAIE